MPARKRSTTRPKQASAASPARTGFKPGNSEWKAGHAESLARRQLHAERKAKEK